MLGDIRPSSVPLPSGWHPLDLNNVHPINGTTAHQADGSISFAGEFDRWGYIAHAEIPQDLKGLDLVHVRATVELHSGAVGFGVLKADKTDFHQQTFVSAPGEHMLECKVQCPEDVGGMILRHGSAAKGQTQFVLKSLEFYLPEPKVWRSYDLNFVGPHGSAAMTRENGKLVFSGGFVPWAYMAMANMPVAHADAGILKLRATLNIQKGAVGLGIFSSDRKDFYKQAMTSKLGDQIVELTAYCPDPPGGIVFRHGKSERAETIFELKSLEFAVPATEDVSVLLAPPTHHPIFSRFPVWSGIVPAGKVTNWLGTVTSGEYFPSGVPLGERYQASSLPFYDEEYFEWIDLLEAVAAAETQFTMVELGAGWGRWLVDAHVALRQVGKADIATLLVGVEAEPRHFQWMIDHFIENGIGPSQHRLIEAAVAAKDGSVRFATGHSKEWYGQFIVGSEWRPHSRYPEATTREVRAVSLETVVEGIPLIDLIDMDIQGAEADVLGASRDILQERVKRVHIGTHGDNIETSLRELFGSLGWICRADYPNGRVAKTPYGPISFGDGVQSWLNPRFLTENRPQLNARTANTRAKAVRKEYPGRSVSGKDSQGSLRTVNRK